MAEMEIALDSAAKERWPMRYTNPILLGDYSDPDVIRVDEDFYMISSSFTYVPGIPVLHSRDLVHWELIGYAARRLPFPQYDRPAHKRGIWAPSLRYHNGTFYVYVCMPDEGLFSFTAKDPAGEWECHYVKDVTGWIDPCPLFDDDGRVWLVHGFAASRAGINNVLYVHKMSADGLTVVDKGRMVYDGGDHGDITVEGPKIYKREGKYWILCPAGSVKPGYQLALRADSIYGPYERRVVLSQGSTPINGPHQGGWVEDGHGKDWFIHFQDMDAYGRVVHLQPVDWSDGWPMMGKKGSPVLGGTIDLPPWQWQANPNKGWYTETNPGLRLHAAPAASLFEAGNFLSQLMQSHDFDMDAVFWTHAQDGDISGIGMMGYTYYYIALGQGRVSLKMGMVNEISRWVPERVTETPISEVMWPYPEISLRMRVRRGNVSFYYGEGQQSMRPLGGEYPMTCGGWTGARPGIFTLNTLGRWGGWADVKYVKITNL